MKYQYGTTNYSNDVLRINIQETETVGNMQFLGAGGNRIVVINDPYFIPDDSTPLPLELNYGAGVTLGTVGNVNPTLGDGTMQAIIIYRTIKF